MKKITLYVERDSFLSRLHPFAKLSYIAAAIFSPFLAGNRWCFLIAILVSLLLLGSCRLLRKTLPLLAFSFTIIATVLVIHGLFDPDNQTLFCSLGALHFYREGLLRGLGIGLNILNMLLAFAVFVLATKPQDLVNALEQRGFSPRFGYIITSVFQIIPQMMGTMSTIMDAQKSRGMETEGSLIRRAKAFIPLIAPVVSSSLINTRERAIALEVRGFGAKTKKTFLETDRVDRLSRSVIAAAVLCLVGALVWRIANGIH